MGGVASYFGVLRKRDRLQGGREAPGAVVEEIGCYVKGYFGGSKGAALEIRQAWKNRRRR